MTTVADSALVATSIEAVDSTALLNQILNKSANGVSNITGVVIGRFDGYNAHGKPIVSVEQLGLNAIVTRTTINLINVPPGSEVALAFVMGDLTQALILASLLYDSGKQETPSIPMPAVEAQQHINEVEATEILVDGERVVFQAEHEIELRCGEAAIILSCDGRIELRGTYITSKASATQRILGGSVNIN